MSSESAWTTDMTDDDVDPKQHKSSSKRKKSTHTPVERC